MKKVLTKVATALRIAAGTVCAIFAVTCLVLIFTEEPVAVFVLMAVIFAGLTALLLIPRKKKRAPEPVKCTAVPAGRQIEFDVPEEILQEMRGAYSVMQAKDDARIMLDSFKLVQQTTNLDTFLSRLHLCRQKALTLLQAEKAGIKGLRQIGMTDKCNYILSTVPEAKAAFLERSSFTAITSAFQLKTPAGQRRKLQTYLDSLGEHRTDFMDVEHEYTATIERIQEVIP